MGHRLRRSLNALFKTYGNRTESVYTIVAERSSSVRTNHGVIMVVRTNIGVSINTIWNKFDRFLSGNSFEKHSKP